MTTTDDLEPLVWNVRQAARLLGVGQNTLRDMIRRGELRGIRIGKRILIPKVALEAFVTAIGTSEAEAS